ncbi:MAG: permease [Tepidanaerobacteraceae bacterium]|nr:permease [Tepidanaerobacteraceae bacterium]
MDIFTRCLWVITAIAFTVSIIKDKERTFHSMKMAKGMMKGMMGQIIGILFLIGLILSFIPPEIIKQYLGGPNILTSSIFSAIIGSITLIPAFVAFPLIGSLINMGASVVPAVAFLTTLTMVGFVTFPLEKQEFGFKFAVVRNSLSFVFAIIIALVMGALI